MAGGTPALQDLWRAGRPRSRICGGQDARLRPFAAAGGLRPGIHAGYPWTNATARGPFTGLLAGTALSLPIPLAEPLERVAQGEETA